MTEHEQMDRVDTAEVILVHPWVIPRTAMVPYLEHLRPQYAFQAVPPDELEDVLVGTGNTVVVICDTPTPVIQDHAKGWLVMPFDGPHVAVAGVGEEHRAFSSDDFDAMLETLDELVAGEWQREDVG